MNGRVNDRTGDNISDKASEREIDRRAGWRVAALVLLFAGYLMAAGYQLGLPGLHYDEAREAGINAMELIQGAPVTAFRNATVQVGAGSLPLMVQDYIGALNVYWVAPFLALTGVGVPNLRWPAILIGLATLILLERGVSEWWAWHTTRTAQTPVSWAGVIAVALLALSPSFVFWSRQGIFVTNLTQPLCLAAIWLGVRWLRRGDAISFTGAIAAAGAALYAKLLAVWLLAPFALAILGLLWYRRRRGRQTGLSPARLLLGVGVFAVVLSPLILFNLQTGGTFEQLLGNLGQSYYGVDNRAWGENLAVRLGQLVQTLRGDHFWYLGGVYGNAAAPWVALLGIAAIVPGFWIGRGGLVGGPLLLAAGAVGLSIFTISDLFITHYALVQPVAVAAIAIGLALWSALWLAAWPVVERTGSSVPLRKVAVGMVGLLVVLWVAFDGMATLRYHRALAQSGGLADHSDATYHFAYALQYNGMGAPIALDWGMDAPVRYLSANTVQPIEIFGYASPAAPDENFVGRLAVFLDNPDNVYLLRSPEQTVFAGRRELFLAESAARGYTPVLVDTFAQRDGVPLFEVWRVAHAGANAWE